MIDIFSLSVEEIALKIKDGQLTSVDVCENCLLYTSDAADE